MKIASEKPQVKKMMTDEVVALNKTLIKYFLQWKFDGKSAGHSWNSSQTDNYKTTFPSGTSGINLLFINSFHSGHTTSICLPINY
jgi:hypothetical protein